MYLLYLLMCAVLVSADIITKQLAVTNMSVGSTVPLIENVFHLTYVRNTGAAFSILSGQKIFLILLPIVIIAVILVYIAVKKPKNKLLLVSFSMIISGGIGNLIDRISLGYVIDFFDFRLINFPVFNVADIWVTLGGALFVILLLFSKEDLI